MSRLKRAALWYVAAVVVLNVAFALAMLAASAFPLVAFGAAMGLARFLHDDSRSPDGTGD